MKVLMIVNPVSGRFNSRRKLLDALSIFSKAGYRVEVFVTSKRNDATNYVKKHGRFYDLVVACGGDGTLNEVTNGLMSLKNKPCIGYFPSGTMNDFSNNFNLTNDWEETARKIVEGSEHEFDVGLFDDKRYFNYVAAFGAMCDVPYETPQETKATLGNLAYILVGANKLQDIHPIKTKVTVNGKSEEYNSMAGIIFSGYHVSGIELVDKKKGKMDDGVFNALIIEFPENIFEMADLLKILTKKNSKYYHWYSSQEIQFEFEESDIVWTVDGEMASADKKVSIKNLNKALRIKC